jgi:hypothetical protein
LRGLDLTGANLDDADLKGADLHGTILNRASLVRANLASANQGRARSRRYGRVPFSSVCNSEVRPADRGMEMAVGLRWPGSPLRRGDFGVPNKTGLGRSSPSDRSLRVRSTHQEGP